jgi:CRISPR/Cas system CSM-associated protein Csm2 small subunit
MDGRRQRREEIVWKLRQVAALQGQSATIAEAVRRNGVTQQRSHRWRKPYDGIRRSQPCRLKALEKKNQWLRRALCDLTLMKPILTEAARGVLAV